MEKNPFYEKNLSCLRKRDPHCAARLPSSAPIKELSTESTPSHKWIQDSLKENCQQIILLGTESGQTINTILEQYNPLNLIVIEKSMKRFAGALAASDLTNALSDPHVFWIIGDSLSDILPGIEYVKTSLAAHGFQCVHSPNSSPPDRPFYQKVAEIIHREIEREATHLKTRLARGMLSQRNLIANVPVSIRSLSPDNVANAFLRKPAVVIAAGPSLDQNIGALEKANDSTLLISVDTATRALLQACVQPHVIVTSDPSPDNVKHFDGIDLPPEILLAYLPDTHYEILRRFTNLPRLLCLFDDSARLNYWLREILGFHRLLIRPTNVAEAAIRLALLMGCDPIILVGLDLALAPVGGKTHTQAGALSKTIKNYSQNQVQIETETGAIISQNLVQVPGWNSELLPSYPSFKLYLERLEELIADTPITWIDATEGGARKRGCAQMTLAAALTSIPNKKPSINEQLRRIPPPDDSHSKKYLKTFQQALNRLCNLRDDLQSIAQGTITGNAAESIWNEFLQNKEIRAMLDHAVFQFQLLPPLSKIVEQERAEFLRNQSQNAIEIINLFIPLWETALSDSK